MALIRFCISSIAIDFCFQLSDGMLISFNVLIKDKKTDYSWQVHQLMMCFWFCLYNDIKRISVTLAKLRMTENSKSVLQYNNIITSILCIDQNYMAPHYHRIEFYLTDLKECSIWRLSVGTILTGQYIRSFNYIETFCSLPK